MFETTAARDPFGRRRAAEHRGLPGAAGGARSTGNRTCSKSRREYLDDVSHLRVPTKAEGVKTAIRSNGVLRDTLQKLGRIGDRVSMIRESLMSVGRIAPFVRDMRQGLDLSGPARRG